MLRGSPARRRAIAAAALALPVLLGTAPPAVAAEDEDTIDDPAPPARMSTIGGELLGRSGTQVKLLDGAPRLPRTTCRAWIVADADSGDVLAAKNAHWPLAPASTIKMLFADTLLGSLDKEQSYLVDPADFVDMGAGSSRVGIADGQTYTVDQLWYGVFLASGNDAVYALTALNGGKEKTVRQMNERAEELQAMDTRVVNPDGYDGPGQVSSAYDLTLFARAGMRDEDFRRYASTATYDFPGAVEEDEQDEDEDGPDGDGGSSTGGEDPRRGDGPEKPPKRPTYQIQSTNRLLVGDSGLDPYKGIMGVKNGYTSKAGFTYTGMAERNGRTLIATCMNPEDDDRLRVYKETAALFDWGFTAAGKVEPVGELVPSLTELAEQEAQEAEKNGKDAGDGEDGEDRGLAEAAGEKDGSSGGPVGTVTLLSTTTALMVGLLAGAWLLGRRRRGRNRPLRVYVMPKRPDRPSGG